MTNTAEFYRSDDYQVDVVQGQAGYARRTELPLTVSPAYRSISGIDIVERMRQLNSEAEVLEQDGYTFEVKRFSDNGEASEDEVSISTISSGISNNNGPGNFFETIVATLADEREAARSGRAPHRRLYVSSAGNGRTSPLSKDEIGDFKNTGRLISDTGEPTPWASALHKALVDYGAQTQHIDSDSFGAVLATAYGTAVGGDHIKSMFQNGRPQFLGRNRLSYIGGMLYEGARGTSHNEQMVLRSNIRDRWAVLGAQKELAKREAPAVFDQTGASTTIGNLDRLALTKGLHRGPRLTSLEDPLFDDTRAFLTANPNARLAMVNALHDQQSPQMVYPTHMHYERMLYLARRLSRIGQQTVSLATMPGNHSWHTYNPGLRHEIKNQLLSR